MCIDPKIKEHVQNYLEGNNHHHNHHHQQQQQHQQYSDKTRMISTTTAQLSRSNHRVTTTTTSEPIQSRPSRIPTIIRSPIHSSSKSCPQSPHDQKTNKTSHQQQQQQQQLQYIQKSNGGTSSFFASHAESTGKKKCGFEAYMMTGDLILNLSRNQQSADILTTQFKKVSASSHCVANAAIIHINMHTQRHTLTLSIGVVHRGNILVVRSAISDNGKLKRKNVKNELLYSLTPCTL